MRRDLPPGLQRPRRTGVRGSPRQSRSLPCTDGLGRILRLIDSPGQPSGLRYARALIADIPATNAALDRGYISAKLHADLAAQGCTVHTPPKKGMLNPPPWDKAIYARRLMSRTSSRV
jgi:hypothetical protein